MNGWTRDSQFGMWSISKNEQLGIKFSWHSNCENGINTVRFLLEKNFMIFRWVKSRFGHLFSNTMDLLVSRHEILFRWLISGCSFCWVDSMDCSHILDNQAWNWQGRSFKIDELVFLGINILLQSCVTWFCNMFCDMLVKQSF